MANVTLAIDDDVLRRARAKAAERGTSVNSVIRDLLDRYAGPSEAGVALESMFAVADSAGASIGDAGITWAREDLHDRPYVR
jgi:hypothetical protein